MRADVARGWGYVGNAPVRARDPFGLASGEWFGSADPENIDPKDPDSYRGANAGFTWTPPADAKCSKFNFIQVADTNLGDRTWPLPDDKRPWHVDNGGNCWSPYYGVESENGIGFKDKPGKGRWFPFGSGYQHFILCAVCECGEDEGKIYGCIKWGYDIGPGGRTSAYPGPKTRTPGIDPPQEFTDAYNDWKRARDRMSFYCMAITAAFSMK